MIRTQQLLQVRPCLANSWIATTALCIHVSLFVSIATTLFRNSLYLLRGKPKSNGDGRDQTLEKFLLNLYDLEKMGL